MTLQADKTWRDIEPPPGEPGERDWGALAFKVAQEHLEAVDQHEACMEGECETHPHAGYENPEAPSCPNPAAGYGCMGCNDCYAREVLAITWPVVEAAIRSGDFDSPDDAPAAAGDSSP